MILSFPKARETLVTPPASEPVSLSEAKEQLSIGGGSEHNTRLTRLITAARELWEHDTESAVLTQTWQVKLDRFFEFRFLRRPVASISSVTYYNSSNVSTALASSVYVLDDADFAFRLQPDQDFPTTYTRFDAVTIQYVLGVATADELSKQAILLLVSHYFENPDML